MSESNVPDGQIDAAILAAVKKAVSDTGPEADAQVAEARRLVRGLSHFKSFTDSLVDFAISILVYRARHQVKFKAIAGEPDEAPPKLTEEAKREHIKKCETSRVRADLNPLVQTEVAKSFMRSYYIGGTCFGELRGEQLPGLIAKCRQSAKTNNKDADLMEWAARNGLKEGVRAFDVIDDDQFRKAHDRIAAKYAA